MISTPIPERVQLLAQLEENGSPESVAMSDVARHLLTEHPCLPLHGLATSITMRPGPDEARRSLILHVGEHDTAGITAWAHALDTEPVIDGAVYRLDTAINGIGIWASATVPAPDYPMDDAVFTPSSSDIPVIHRGLQVTELGEDGVVLVIGHPPVRDVLAASSAYYRDTCGQRLHPLDGHALARSRAQFVAYPTRTEWQVRTASPDTPGALPVTWMHTQGRDTQDLGHLDHCPVCRRPSRGLDVHRDTGQPVHGCPSPACQQPVARYPGRSMSTSSSPGTASVDVDPYATPSATIETFDWQASPDGLATRRQLRALGLRPGGRDPVAQLRCRTPTPRPRPTMAWPPDRLHTKPRAAVAPAVLGVSVPS
ncbi:hypothetical protein OG521_39780 (plasmid) [Streptomyces sp. NBC_01463]